MVTPFLFDTILSWKGNILAVFLCTTYPAYFKILRLEINFQKINFQLFKTAYSPVFEIKRSTIS
jgi:hypothetical protein